MTKVTYNSLWKYFSQNQWSFSSECLWLILWT